jgi:hypothetical protein
MTERSNDTAAPPDDHAADSHRTVPLDDQAGGERVIEQQPSGTESIGGGEFPDPDSPPRGPSPGTAGG